MDFSDQVVLITGASAGIGKAIAELLSEHGATLALVGRNAENLRMVAEKCRGVKGKDVLEVVADLATDDGCEQIAKATVQRFGRLDVLINNAGMGARTCIQRAEMTTFDEVFNTNVRGVYNLTRLLVPELIKSKGNIVNVSSVSAYMTSVGSLPYSMSKAALDHFTRCIALELAPLGVRVNTISPGVTRTTFVQRLTGYDTSQYESWLRDAARGIPLGRVCDAAEIARMVACVAWSGASAVTGAILPVDGGLALAGVGHSDIMTRQMK